MPLPIPLQLLLAKGADVNARRNAGDTPLHHAAYGGHLEAIKALLRAGADVNAQKGDGITPLLMAAAKEREEVVEVRLEGRSVCVVCAGGVGVGWAGGEDSRLRFRVGYGVGVLRAIRRL